VPLIIKGPDIPQGVKITAPASHVDTYPFILESTGASVPEAYDTHPGKSLFKLATGAAPDRSVLSEYHGMGSTTGAFMIRHGKYKYVHYVAYPPQLFDLEADPEELSDLAEKPEFSQVLAACRQRLYEICDPAEVDARAKRRQAELLEENGGRDAVIKRGDLGFSPPPGYPIILG